MTDYDIAAELCEMVEKRDLWDYLQIAPNSDPSEIRAKLKTRRKFLQSMRANPKFEAEAKLFIRNFDKLMQLVDQQLAYNADVTMRIEDEGLRALEDSVRAILNAGPPTKEQRAWLRERAKELNVGSVALTETIERLAQEYDVLIPYNVTPPMAGDYSHRYSLPPMSMRPNPTPMAAKSPSFTPTAAPKDSPQPALVQPEVPVPPQGPKRFEFQFDAKTLIVFLMVALVVYTLVTIGGFFVMRALAPQANTTADVRYRDDASARALLDQAQVATNQGNVSLAVDLLEQATRLEQVSPDLRLALTQFKQQQIVREFVTRAQQAVNIGEPSNARTLVGRALELSPTDKDALALLDEIDRALPDAPANTEATAKAEIAARNPQSPAPRGTRAPAPRQPTVPPAEPVPEEPVETVEAAQVPAEPVTSPPPEPLPAPSTMLTGVDVDATASSLTLLLSTTGKSVRPLHYLIDDAGGTSTYVIRLADTGKTIGFERLPLASKLASSVTISTTGSKTELHILGLDERATVLVDGAANSISVSITASE